VWVYVNYCNFSVSDYVQDPNLYMFAGQLYVSALANITEPFVNPLSFLLPRMFLSNVLSLTLGSARSVFVWLRYPPFRHCPQVVTRYVERPILWQITLSKLVTVEAEIRSINFNDCNTEVPVGRGGYVMCTCVCVCTCVVSCFLLGVRVVCCHKLVWVCLVSVLSP
jgi:hypothetical protein